MNETTMPGRRAPRVHAVSSVLAALGVAAVLFVPSLASAATQIDTVELWSGRPIFATYMTFADKTGTSCSTGGGTDFTLELTGLSTGADPVMRVMQSNYSTSQPRDYAATLELWRDDDSGQEPGAPRIVFCIGDSEVLESLVVVHGHTDEESSGTAVLELNGDVIDEFAFGGAYVELGAALNQYDLVQTVYEPNGVTQAQLLATSSTFSLGLGYSQLFGSDDFSRGEYEHGNWSDPFYGGGYVGAPTQGVLTLVHNDLAYDLDGDGLGNGLEWWLGTCRQSSDVTRFGWDCTDSVTDDTDLDGLKDVDEVLGRGEQHLRYWGADPIHKDVFVEVDFDTNFPGKLNPAGTFDEFWASQVVSVYEGGSATEYANPDGLSRLRLHFDVSKAPYVSTSTNPGLIFHGGGSGTTANDGASLCESGEHHARRLDSQDSDRHDLFHYLCVGDDEMTGKAPVPGLALASPQAPVVVAHELGHNLGLYHGGFDAQKQVSGLPNYHSIMNYSFLHAAGQLSHGTDLSLYPPSLCEADGVGVLPEHLGPGSAHSFPVSTTTIGIDWDRDGNISSCASQRRGDLLTTPYGTVSDGATFSHCYDTAPTFYTLEHPIKSVAAVRFTTGLGAELLYVFYTTDQGGVYYRAADVSDGFSWILPATLLLSDTDLLYVDASALNDGSDDLAIYLAVTDVNGEVQMFRADVDPGDASLTETHLDSFNNEFVVEPAALVQSQATLYLFMRRGDGRVSVYGMDTSETWSGFGLMQWRDILVAVDVLCNGPPSVAEDGNRVLTVACAVGSGHQVTLYRSPNGASSTWDLASDQPSLADSKRTALFWHPHITNDPQEGLWTIGYGVDDLTGSQSYVKLHKQDLGRGTWDDAYFCAQGSLTTSYLDFEWKLGDNNAFAAWPSYEPALSSNALQVAPLADGVVRFTLYDNNDYVAIGQDTSTVNPWQGSGACAGIATANQGNPSVSVDCVPGGGGSGGSGTFVPFEDCAAN